LIKNKSKIYNFVSEETGKNNDFMKPENADNIAKGIFGLLDVRLLSMEHCRPTDEGCAIEDKEEEEFFTLIKTIVQELKLERVTSHDIKDIILQCLKFNEFKYRYA
jgi:hypothetical protein